MSLYTILNIIIISFLIAFLINNFFIYNKTSYLLIFSIFIFNSISILFFILELEFIAITFSMIYVGGIAVMFLFLILVVDVNIENVEGSKIITLKLLPCFIIALVTIVTVQLLVINFDAFTFNTLDFIEFSSDLINFNFYINLDEIFIYNQLGIFNAIDLWILSISLFKSFSILIILVAIYLFVAIIVSLIFCSNVFEKNLNIKF
jgi:NADH:ubiquinone oxidoreductase subunit 6 (subunit J)